MIEGTFRKKLGYSRPMVQAKLWIPRISPDPVVLDFLIDTGADTASLHPLDSLWKMGITPERFNDRSQWGEQRDIAGIGGNASSFVEAAHFAFRHVGGREQEIEQNIFIMVPSEANKEFPSILGWEVLRHFNLRMSWNRLAVSLYDVHESEAP